MPGDIADRLCDGQGHELLFQAGFYTGRLCGDSVKKKLEKNIRARKNDFSAPNGLFRTSRVIFHAYSSRAIDTAWFGGIIVTVCHPQCMESRAGWYVASQTPSSVLQKTNRPGADRGNSVCRVAHIRI